LHYAGYPFAEIYAPPPDTAVWAWTNRWLPLFPPSFLGEPVIYFAIAVAFTLVLAVFI